MKEARAGNAGQDRASNNQASRTRLLPQNQVLQVIEIEHRRDRFRAKFDGRVLVKSSRTPFLDAARVLLALGCDPDSIIAMKHKGSDVVALRSRLGAAAKLMVEDCPGGSKPPRFVRYRARDRVEGSPGTATDGHPDQEHREAAE
jgi:hypothetical protein